MGHLEGRLNPMALTQQGQEGLLFCRKEAKDFTDLASRPWRGTLQTSKVFWFFFPKKNALCFAGIRP
jgi:hypothetical protein